MERGLYSHLSDKVFLRSIQLENALYLDAGVYGIHFHLEKIESVLQAKLRMILLMFLGDCAIYHFHLQYHS
jgi:hypothetical protein